MPRRHAPFAPSPGTLGRLFSVAAAIAVVAAFAAVTPPRARAAPSTGPFYVSPTGSDSNDCLSAATACLTLYHVTNDLASPAAESLHNADAGAPSEVDVYLEPGTWSGTTGYTQNGTGFTSCDSTTTICTAMQVVDAAGYEDTPIVVESDPDNSGISTFQRITNANTSEQKSPLVLVWDSQWVQVRDLDIEGVGTTGCSGSCVTPTMTTGELAVSYASTALPVPQSESGISLDNLTVEDSAFNCVFISYAEYMNIEGNTITSCRMYSSSGSEDLYLGAGNETVQDNTISNSTGDGIYVSTANGSYPAYPETIAGNTIDDNAAFGSNTGVGEGGLASNSTVLEYNEVFQNGSGGFQLNWGAFVEYNSIYSNYGPGIQLNWTTTYNCACNNTIQNNSFYEDAGEEMQAASGTNPIVDIRYNIFRMGTGDHVWAGQFDVFCSGNGPPQYSVVDSNDYYGESPQNSSPNYEYGTNTLYEAPAYVSTASGDINLEPENSDITAESPPWGAYDPSTLDASTGSTEPVVTDPTAAGPAPTTVTTASWNSGAATITVASTSGMSSGETVAVDGITPVGYDGNFPITLLSSTRFSYTLGSDPGAYYSGGTAFDASAPETESAQTMTTLDTWDMAGTTYGTGTGTEQVSIPYLAPPTGSADMPLFTDSQAASQTVPSVDSLQQTYGPGSGTETYDQFGWARPPSAAQVLCPEPTAENGWGTKYGLPNESACNATGTQAYWPSGYWPKGPKEPSSSPPNGSIDSGFNEAFCGPGSATEIAYSWDPKRVANYGGEVVDGNRSSFNIPKGWYRYFYHEVYRLMGWSYGSNKAFGDGWSAWWGGEMKELNLEIGNAHHFTWMKSGPGAPSSSSPHYLSQQNLYHALKHDLAGTKRGNLFAAVYTGNMSNWNGTESQGDTNFDANAPYAPDGSQGWNHYVSISGYNKSADKLEYADTAASWQTGTTPAAGPFGYYQLRVSDFLQNDIQENAVAAKNSAGSPIQYFSDRVVLW
jgi:hypothetical protein